MRRKTPQYASSSYTRSKVVIFTGGIKQDISQLEMDPGNLIGGFNYHEEDGNSHGYRSILGYERFDGTQLASEVDGNEADDTARELRRSEILEVPGNGSIQAVHIHNNDVFAIRESPTNPLESLMYMSTSSGWSAPLASVDTLTSGASYDIINVRYDLLTGLQREEIFLFVNGVDAPMYYNGTSLVSIVSTFLPTIQPSYCIEFKNRLFLGYSDGRVVFSAVGDPTDFDPISGAGDMYFESPITGFVTTPGDALAVFCEETIQIIQALADIDGSGTDSISLYKFKNELFSKRSGGISGTIQRIYGNIVFMDDRGLTTLEQTDTFGDFGASSVSKNVQGTLLSKKSEITTSVVKRDLNQYRLFFSDGSGYVLTYNIDKEVKGITALKYNTAVLNVSEGEDIYGDDLVIFGSNDGYVYKMDSGTSFDGSAIYSKMVGTFYSYGTPSTWKRFHKVVLETTASSSVEIFGRVDFNYKGTFMPRTAQESFDGEDAGGAWGIDEWSQFIYSSTVTQTPSLYLTGIGNNMSLTIVTENKYSQPHTIQSMVVDYSLLERMA